MKPNIPAGRDANTTFRELDGIMPQVEKIVANKKKQQKEETKEERKARLNKIAADLSRKIKEYQKNV